MRFLSKIKLHTLSLCVFLFVVFAAEIGIEARTWYPVTAGSFTGLRPTPTDQILITEHDFEKGITYGLRCRSKERTTTTFLVLDLGEAEKIFELQFQNQTNRAATTNIGFIEVFVAEGAEEGNFDPFLKDNYSKSVYRGAIQPVSNSQGAIRKIRFPEIERRYFLIEVFADNKNIGNVGKEGFVVDTVQFSDILVSVK